MFVWKMTDCQLLTVVNLSINRTLKPNCSIKVTQWPRNTEFTSVVILLSCYSCQQVLYCFQFHIFHFGEAALKTFFCLLH